MLSQCYYDPLNHFPRLQGHGCLLSWFKDKSLSSIDYDDLLGGILIAWEPNLKVISLSSLNFCIVMDLKDYFHTESFHLINVYDH